MTRKLGQNNVPFGGLAFGIFPAFSEFAVWKMFNLMWILMKARPQDFMETIEYVG